MYLLGRQELIGVHADGQALMQPSRQSALGLTEEEDDNHAAE